MTTVRPLPPETLARRPLGPRQYDVLRLLAKGQKYERIGHELGISARTVRNMVHRAYLQLGAENGPHAVAILDDREPGWR